MIIVWDISIWAENIEWKKKCLQKQNSKLIEDLLIKTKWNISPNSISIIIKLKYYFKQLPEANYFELTSIYFLSFTSLVHFFSKQRLSVIAKEFTYTKVFYIINYNHCQKYKEATTYFNLKSTYFTQVCCHGRKFSRNTTVYDAKF